MSVFAWARRPTPSRTLELPGDRPVYVVSDVHLGDGSRSDSFVGKDREFLEFLDHVQGERSHLVIAGDIIDFPQAVTFTRVLRAHGPILRRISELAADTGVSYAWGNHDYDIALYRDLLRWDVCSSVRVGSNLELRHGHQFDPYVSQNMRESAFSTLIHHQVERLLGTWIRLPLEDFYTLTGRFVWWASRRWVQVVRPFHRLLGRLGVESPGEGLDAFIRYWLRSQLGDSMLIFPEIRSYMAGKGPHWLVTGHSHLPGRVELAPGRWYVNTGSWTFRNAQYARWDGAGVQVRDWLTGRVYEAENYERLLSGALDSVTFDRWWAEEYQGWLRFRCGERRRRGLPPEPWYLGQPTASALPVRKDAS